MPGMLSNLLQTKNKDWFQYGSHSCFTLFCEMFHRNPDSTVVEQSWNYGSEHELHLYHKLHNTMLLHVIQQWYWQNIGQTNNLYVIQNISQTINYDMTRNIVSYISHNILGSFVSKDQMTIVPSQWLLFVVTDVLFVVSKSCCSKQRIMCVHTMR